MTEAQLSAFYPQDYGAYVGAQGRLVSLLQSAYHAWRDRLTLRTPPLSFLRHSRAGHLLDVGCGKGDPGALMLRLGWQVFGIDPSPRACELARMRGLAVTVGTLQTAEIDADAFDAILFHHSLEHVTNPLDELRRAAELVRPGGVILISVPNFDSWQRKTLGTYWTALDLPRHRTHFTAGALTSALEACGFRDCSTSTQTSLSILPLSLQFAMFGRPLFRGPISRRLVTSIYFLLFPLSRLADLVGGDGDVLTVVATRPEPGALPAPSS